MKKGWNKAERKDVYKVITDKVIELLEQGLVPWRKTWKGENCNSSSDAPRNFLSKKAYQGINLFMLNCTPYQSPYFLTYHQAKEKGGQVRKGEKGFPIVFWKFNEYENPDTGKIKTVPFARYSTVFNLEQCDGIKKPEEKKPEENKPSRNKQHDFKPIKHAEAIVKGYIGKPNIKHAEQRAYYVPSVDYVNMPEKDTFENPETYYNVLFHELTHSTGHKTRLDREGISAPHFFGDKVYSKEELIAEFGATFLSSECGISNDGMLNNSASYIKGWARKLKQDKKLLIQASGMATKAVNKILGIKSEREG